MSTPLPPTPSQPGNPSPAPATSKPARSSYDELDSPSRSLPPVVPILIAAVVIGIVLFFVISANRPVTPATGYITKTFYVEQNTKDRVMVGVEVHIKNGSDKPIFVRDVAVKVTTASGELTDTPAPANDVSRYLAAYPELKQSNAGWIGDNTKLAPGAERDALFIVGYVITKDVWEQRKALEVTINLYDQKPLILKQ